MQQCEDDQEQKRQKRAATRDAYKVANKQRMAARRALEWIGMLKARLVFRYETSDLLIMPCSTSDWYNRFKLKTVTTDLWCKANHT